MTYIVLYLLTGIAVYGALMLLFRKTGVDRKGLHNLWLWSAAIDWGFVLVPLLWPLFALLSLVWWLLDYWHIKSKQADARAKAEALKHANKYSHLTTDELLAAQKKVIADSQKATEDHPH